MFITAIFPSRTSLTFLKQAKRNARQTGATGKEGAVGTAYSDELEGAELCRDEKEKQRFRDGRDGPSTSTQW